MDDKMPSTIRAKKTKPLDLKLKSIIIKEMYVFIKNRNTFIKIMSVTIDQSQDAFFCYV